MGTEFLKDEEVFGKSPQIIEVSTDRGMICIPIWYSLNVQEKYFDEYEESKDPRKAFCALVLSMVEDNASQTNQSIENININDIYGIDDKYLIDILELIVMQSDDLTQYYKKNSTDNYFEDFYNSISYERDKYMSEFKKAFKIPESLKSTINSISRINIPTHVTESFQQISKFSEQASNAYKNTPDNYTYNFINPIQSQYQVIINKIEKIYENISKSFSNITSSNAVKKLPKKIKEINTELLKFGWYTFGEFSIEGINQLYKVINEYKNDKDVNRYKRNVNKIMNEFIENESEELIKKILKTFPNRYRIIRDAFNAHKRKLYTLSIPVFLTQLDGICKEMLGVSLYSKTKNKPKTKNELENILKENNIKIEEDSFIYSMLYYPLEILSCLVIDTDEIDRKYNRNEIYSKFNRHAIIHGTDIRYNNRTNSNKCIAILSYLCDLKNEIDETKKP